MGSGTGKVETDYYAPRFSILIKGVESVDVSKSIVSVQVNQKLNYAAEANISVTDEITYTDQESLRFKWLDSDLFQVGNRVTIKMGYAGKLQEMIAGKITRLDSSFFTGGAPTVTLTVKDPMHIITKKVSDDDRDKFNKKHRSAKDSDIAKFICELINHKLNVELKPQISKKIDIKHKKLQLKGQTTFQEFLRQRAGKIYYEFYIRDNIFYFGEPKTGEEEVKTIQWHRDLISFKPCINSAELVTEVKVKSRDSSTGKFIEETAKMNGLEAREKAVKKLMAKFYDEAKEVKKEITNIPVYSEREAKLVAMAQLKKASDTIITGEAETIGMPDIRPGVNVRLEKLGDWFSGKYYVVEATHTIDSSGYRTRFKGRRGFL